jgi:subtilisin family serine protease
MLLIRRITLFLVVFCALLTAAAEFANGSVFTPELQTILRTSDPNEEISVIIIFTDKANLTFENVKDRGIHRASIIKALKNRAESSQHTITTYLKNKGIKHIRPLWIINGLSIKAPARIISTLAAYPGVENITQDSIIKAPQVLQGNSSSPEWNITMVHAPTLWSMGFSGQGVVVANMDTGVDVAHSGLSSKWRGGTNSWFDPIGEHATPYDNDGHGTGTMGIMIGGSTGGTAIGMAPDAKWIAVKIFDDSGNASLSMIHQGFQWLLDPDGNPNTDDAPDVVNNSWGLEYNVNQCLTDFQSDIAILKAANIAAVFSAGNAGPSASTSVSPANLAQSFSVGDVSVTMAIDTYSSRGPSTCTGSIFPYLVAPGVNIRTYNTTFGGALPDQYITVSGTSFAAPHVAGGIALLLSAFPHLTNTQLESALKASAYDLGIIGPDNVYGFGLLDVAAAYQNIEATACKGDINRNGKVDLTDMEVIAIDWLREDCASGSPCLADIDHDNKVNLTDFSKYGKDFGRTDCP